MRAPQMAYSESLLDGGRVLVGGASQLSGGASVPQGRVLQGSGDTPLEVPLLLTINDAASASPQHFDAADWVRRNAQELERLLAKHGAIVFRFGLQTPEDFGAFVRGFDPLGWNDLPYEESLSYAVRLPVCDRVCTTNEGRTGGMVWHHEQAQAPRYPSRLFFYCEVPAQPGTGGGTGVTPSWYVHDRLQEAFPDFMRDCESKGVLYTGTLPQDQDSTKGVGRSWRSFFHVETREQAEGRMKELGYTGVWTEVKTDTGEPRYTLRLTSPVLPCVVTAPSTVGPDGSGGTRTFFNQMIAQALSNAREFAKQSGISDEELHKADISQFLTFGDGSPVPLEPLLFAARVADEAAINVEWQQGDMALLDNYLVMHARRPWTGDGPRKVLASLVKGP